ncbi:hypothetical protein P9112_007645 [Eukaryota sp. TZLM1-RC]
MHIDQILNVSEDLEIDVPGTPLQDSQKLTSLRKLCCEMCGWNRDSFPGCQPVSMSKADLSLLSSQDFLVAEKSDGIRYLLLIMGPEQYLIDRNFNFNKLNLYFPSSPKPESPPLSHTLLDGELLKDRKDKEDPSKGFILRYLIFDCIFFHGKSMVKKNLLERLSAASSLEGLRREHGKKGHDFSNEPFEIFTKTMFKTKYTEHVLCNVVPELLHGNDGLIYTPIRDPYIPGTFQKILKWKPPNLNTVDFKLQKEQRGLVSMYQLFAMDRLMLVFYSWITLPENQHQALDADAQATSYVVECLYDPSFRTYIPPPRSSSPTSFEGGQWYQGGWKLQRVRRDRENPNDVRSVERILKAAENAVSLRELISFTKSIGSNIDKNTKAIDLGSEYSIDSSADLVFRFDFGTTPAPSKDQTQLEPDHLEEGDLPVPPTLKTSAGIKRRSGE